MFDFILKALLPSQKDKHQQDLKNEPGGLQPMGDVPRYPPFTEGIPAASASQLIETQTKLIRLIRHELALTETEVEQLLTPLLSSFASFVHLLPASQSHHHRGAGGLFRHSLEVCMWATRISHSRIISGHETGERRKVMEPRWRMAIAVAALCHDIGKAAYDVIVTDAMGKHEWDIYHSNLVEWLEQREIQRYFIRWRGKREHKAHEKFSSLVTMRVIPPQVLSYLNEGDPEIISKMIETISGMTPSGPARVMHELVMEADQLSVSQDIKGQKIAQSDQALGVPVAKYLVDAMKRLIEDGHWKTNTPDSALWVTDNGVFLDWNKASADIAGLLNDDGIRGIPKSRDNMAESLWDFDVILSQYAEDGSERLYTRVAVETNASKTDPNAFEAIEINGIETLYSGPHPTPVKAHVGDAAINAYCEQLQAKREGQQKKKAQERDKQLQRMADKGQSMPMVGENSPSESSGGEAPTQSQPPEDHDQAADAEDGDLREDDTASQKPAQQQDEQPPAEESPELQQDQQPPVNEDPVSTTPEENAQVISPASEQLRSLAMQAQDFLKDLGDAGDVLREGFIPGEGAPARIDGENVVVPFPDGMAHFGEQRNEALESIKEWIEPNPTVSSKLVQKRQIDGERKNVVVVGRQASSHLIALYEAERETEHDLFGETGSPQSQQKPLKPRQPAGESVDKSESAQSKNEQEASAAPQAPKAKKKERQGTGADKEQEQSPKRAPKQKPPKPKSTRSPERIQELLEKHLLNAVQSGEVQTMVDEDGVEWILSDSIALWYQQSFDGKCSRGVVEVALHAWAGAEVGYPHPDNPQKMYVQLTQQGEPA